SPAICAAGHGWLQRLPSNAANGSTMPSRRSTPVANASPPPAPPSDAASIAITAVRPTALRFTARGVYPGDWGLVVGDWGDWRVGIGCEQAGISREHSVTAVI